MNLDESALYALIVGCEIAFWIALLSGLAFRYLLHWPQISRCFLVCVPLIDIALMAFTVIDLRNGAIATFAHGLATAYVGFTVAFGPMVVRWTDQRFAHRFSDGPPPSRPPSLGWASVLYELKLWARCLLAVFIIHILLFAVIAFVDQPGRTQALDTWYRIAFGTAFFWFIFGPLWQLVFFKRESDAM